MGSSVTGGSSLTGFGWTAGICLGVMMAMTSAQAQEQSQPQSAEEREQKKTDTIVVTSTPIQDAQAAALEQKRMSDNVLDIISSDSIGRFPDQNLAESLGRVSGLAIERDQGQARFINFRGAPFRYTVISFDGVSVPGAQNGRIPRFDSFPSAITREIQINKAVTPDMPGEAVAGLINIETFKPFDRGDGFHFSLEGGYGEQALGNVSIERTNGRLSYANDKFGVLIFGSRNKRGRITDNRELDLMIDPETDGIIPNNLDFRSYRGKRVDNAFGGNIEIRATDTVRFFASSIYSEFIDDEERMQYDFDIADDDTPGVSVVGAPVTPGTGYQPVVVIERLLQDGRYKASTFTNTIGVEFEAGDWDMELRGNYTETRRRDFLPLPFSLGGTAAVSYDVTDVRQPILNLFETGTMNPITIADVSFPATVAAIFNSELEVDAYQVKFDAGRDITLFGRDTRIKAGFRIDFRDAKGGEVLNIGGFPGGIDIQSFDTGVLWSSGFDNTIGGTDFDNIGLLEAAVAAGLNIDLPFADDEIIDIEENIYAAYIMATTDFEWGNVVYGGRLEFTDFTSSGTILVDGVPQAVENSDDYVRFLPSLHVNIDLTDDLILRIAGSTGLSRPTYTEARGSFAVDVTDREISGGNPNLKPEFAYGGDVSLEYYFAPGALASVGGFVRWIDNVIYPDTTIIDDASALAPGIFAPGEQVTYNSFFNGENGRIMGLEFALIGQATFLPSPFDGFGMSLNVTLLDSTFDAPTRDASFSLPGTSDFVLNASLYYEKYGFSIRVNYQYRDDWLSTTENDSLTEFWEATDRLDASIRYTIPNANTDMTITLFVDANNLTNERDVRYVNTPRTPNQVEGFGRRFVAGLRIDY